MSFFEYLFCSGCNTALKTNITADIQINSLELLSVSEEIITINLETRISLNCTTLRSTDCLYIFQTSTRTPYKNDSFPSNNFNQNNKIFLESEEGCLIENRSELKLKPGLYEILFLRENNENNEWKVLGNSPIFELNIINNKKKNKNNSSKSEKPNSTLEDTINYTKLKQELFENQALDETFLPLAPKVKNFENYYKDPRECLKRKTMDKENCNPNTFKNANIRNVFN